MDTPTDPGLIDAWIAAALTVPGSPQHEVSGWASAAIMELAWDCPQETWEFVLSVLSLNQSNRVKERLSAGPLETLIACHPYTVINWVEDEAKKNPQFASLLGGVWQNSMPADIWARVQAVWDRRGWDGIPE